MVILHNTKPFTFNHVHIQSANMKEHKVARSWKYSFLIYIKKGITVFFNMYFTVKVRFIAGAKSIKEHKVMWSWQNTLFFIL